ncbi:MAG: hypothetical protein H6Q69_2326 [Firmicutes bacterium]|nr:hypothetical protein [Bacillota bacterium]
MKRVAAVKVESFDYNYKEVGGIPLSTSRRRSVNEYL